MYVGRRRGDLEQAEAVGVAVEARGLAVEGEAAAAVRGPRASPSASDFVLDVDVRHGWSGLLVGNDPCNERRDGPAEWPSRATPRPRPVARRSTRVRDNSVLHPETPRPSNRRRPRGAPSSLPTASMLRTKVVCTLGPASSAPETVLAMVERRDGHGPHQHVPRIADGPPAADRGRPRRGREGGRPVAVLVDLAGPKIRVGDLAEPIELDGGRDGGHGARGGGAVRDEIPTTYAAPRRRDRGRPAVLLDDGLLELRCAGHRGRPDPPGGRARRAR